MNNLVYHGGPVMHTNTVYAILASSISVSTNYESLIDRYFQDEAADSGKLTNVYSADPQYTDGTGSAAYSSTFGGSVVDATAYPSSGCVDSFGIGQQTSVCLTDAQIQTEIDNVATAQGWSRGLSNLFILLTPKNVGSCFSAGMCAYSFYCGYHDDFTSGGSGLTLYANLPYDAYSPAGLACTTGVSPNGDDADATINVASHEHREAITDPEGNAWYDSSGNESTDKCQWSFGTSLGTTGSGSYNQVINGHDYEAQQEWSNSDSGCGVSMAAPAEISAPKIRGPRRWAPR